MAQPVPVASPLKVDQADERTLTVYTSKQALAARCGARRESEGGISETSTNATARTIGRGHPIARDRPQTRVKGKSHTALVRATRRRQEAEANFEFAILAAREAGLTLREIGETVGLSHVRVLQIEQAAREEADRG